MWKDFLKYFTFFKDLEVVLILHPLNMLMFLFQSDPVFVSDRCACIVKQEFLFITTAALN